MGKIKQKVNWKQVLIKSRRNKLNPINRQEK